VKDAIVNRDVTVAVSPQQSDKIDAAHHRMMLARPMARDQFDLPGVRLVQGRVVYDKDASAQAHLALRFGPQRLGIRLKAMQEACECIMGWCLLLVALYFS